MHLTQTIALIVDSFREACDRKIFWVMIAITAFIAAAMGCIGMDASGITLLFGWYHWDVPVERSVAAAILTRWIGTIYIGWVGIIISLIATAGVFPNMMRTGAIDVLVSKPISRSALFLSRYFGGMVFVLVQAGVFVVLTFLVVGFRWHFWFWHYLWCIPLIVVLFSYIFAFSVLFGIWTRSSMTALLLALAAWFAIFIPQTTYETLLQMNSGGSPFGNDGPVVSQRIVDSVKLVRGILPKTQDITAIAGNLINAPTTSAIMISGDDVQSDDAMKEAVRAAIEVERELADVDIVRSIGSSLLFEALIVAFAMRRFNRMDF